MQEVGGTKFNKCDATGATSTVEKLWETTSSHPKCCYVSESDSQALPKWPNSLEACVRTARKVLQHWGYRKSMQI